MRPVAGILLVAIALAAASRAAAAGSNTHLLIIVGLSGDPDHAEPFQRWGGTLADAAGRFGVPRERLTYLAERPDADAKRITARSTREEIGRAFDAIGKNAAADDVVFVVLIGHGTFDGRDARFNLPGPDMSPADFAALLKRVPAKHVVFVNTASASAPFVAALSGPGRTIVTATRTGGERFATLFGGFFVDALTSEAADADKNRRVSVLEAFEYARQQVANAYKTEGLMPTEHPLLDDDGDGRGSGEPSATAGDGRVASVLSLGTTEAAEPLPADPQLRALYVERRELERRIEGLKLLKESMPPDRYAAELEKLVTELALKSREIRSIEGKQDRE